VHSRAVPFLYARLGGELPNIRLGPAMVTADQEGVELYQNLADDLWQRAHKGRDAIKLLQSVLDRSGIKRETRTWAPRGRAKPANRASSPRRLKPAI
jgi:hypothetical protein